MKLEAVHLRDNLYAVRPEGALGTCGWINGQPWTVQYIKATSPAEAVRKANYRKAAQRSAADLGVREAARIF